jgi:MYXO-CTERM domain-containing protein
MRHSIALFALLSLGIALVPRVADAQMDQASTAPSATVNPFVTENHKENAAPFESPNPGETPGETEVVTSGSGGDWGLIGLLGLLGLLGLRKRT